MRDYLLSNTYFRLPVTAHNEPSTLPKEALDVLWGVQEDFLQAAFVRLRRTTAMCPST